MIYILYRVFEKYFYVYLVSTQCAWMFYQICNALPPHPVYYFFSVVPQDIIAISIETYYSIAFPIGIWSHLWILPLEFILKAQLSIYTSPKAKTKLVPFILHHLSCESYSLLDTIGFKASTIQPYISLCFPTYSSTSILTTCSCSKIFRSVNPFFIYVF